VERGEKGRPVGKTRQRTLREERHIYTRIMSLERIEGDTIGKKEFDGGLGTKW